MTRRPVIFYGVNSDGMGHATRVRPVIEHLSRRYDVHVFCGGRAHAFLSARFPRVHRIWHFKLHYRDNRFSLWRTVLWAFLQGPIMIASGFLVFLRAVFLRPVVITDFECLTAWAGNIALCPVVSIDNQHLLRHGDVPQPVPEDARAAAVMRGCIGWNVPFPRRVLISSFFQPPLLPTADARRVRYVPVAPRAEVRAWQSSTSTTGPVLVYQTTATNQRLLDELESAARRTGLAFAVFGMGPGIALADGRVTRHAFSETDFLRHLAAAPFVIVNGGHSTIVECIALGKPVLAEPIQEQYEQRMNAMGLEALGIGRGTRLLSADDIVTFAEQAPAMRERIRRINVVDPDGLLNAVERCVREFHDDRAD